MINQKDIYVGLNQPSNNELLWARPQSNGSVILSVKVNNGWVAANSESGGGQYYSKQEIDNRFADILGIDAEGIAALKALVEDGSALTGLLGEINDKASLSKANTFTKKNTFSIDSSKYVEIGANLPHNMALRVVGYNNEVEISHNGNGITFRSGNYSTGIAQTGNDLVGKIDGMYYPLAYKKDIPEILNSTLGINNPSTKNMSDYDGQSTVSLPLSVCDNAVTITATTRYGDVVSAQIFSDVQDYIDGVLYSYSMVRQSATMKITANANGVLSIYVGNHSSGGSSTDKPVYKNDTPVYTVPAAGMTIHSAKIDIPVSIGDVVSYNNTYFQYSDMFLCLYKIDFKPTLSTVSISGQYDDLLDKPTIPDAQVQVDWAQGDNTKIDFIKNKPSIPDAQIQSDWSQSDNTKKDYIKNKPAIPTALSDLTDDTTHRTVSDTEKSVWDNKSNFSGNYNDLSNKPTIPSYSSATKSQLGLLKVSNKKSSSQTLTETAGTTANRYYGVQMDSNGVAFVNVPWEGTSQTTSYTSGSTMSTNTIYQLTGSNGTSTVANNTSFRLPAISNNTGKAIFIIFKPAGNVSFTCETSGRILYSKGNVSSFESTNVYSATAINDGYRWIVSVNKTDSSL